MSEGEVGNFALVDVLLEVRVGHSTLVLRGKAEELAARSGHNSALRVDVDDGISSLIAEMAFHIRHAVEPAHTCRSWEGVEAEEHVVIEDALGEGASELDIVDDVVCRREWSEMTHCIVCESVGEVIKGFVKVDICHKLVVKVAACWIRDNIERVILC